MLLAIVERMELPGEDIEAFAFLGRYETRLYGQTRSVQLIKEVLQEKIELHRLWMKAVENMPEDTPCHAHTKYQYPTMMFIVRMCCVYYFVYILYIFRQ